MDKEHGYLWYQKNGKPHNRGAYKKPFGRLKKELATVLGHRTGEFTLKVYVKPRLIIEEGVHSYFNLLTELTGIQIKEDHILYPDEIAPEMDGYLESFDAFIRNSSGYGQKNLSATTK